jgi:hypothetical protein
MHGDQLSNAEGVAQVGERVAVNPPEAPRDVQCGNPPEALRYAQCGASGGLTATRSPTCATPSALLS